MAQLIGRSQRGAKKMVVDSTKQLVKNVATGGAVEVSATAGTRYAVAVAGAEVLASIR